MPTPEPPRPAESDAATIPDTDGRGPGDEARDADPWEQMPEDALNRAGVGTDAGADTTESPDATENTDDKAKDSEDTEGSQVFEASVSAQGDVPEATSPERTRSDFLPSPVFILVLGLAGFAGWLSWRAVELDWAAEGTAVTPLIPSLFILLGWIVSVAVHEFAHALAAHLAGDRSQRGGGYLRLNPFAYKQAGGGLFLPLVYLGLSGFGLNGPPTYVDWEAIPGRGRRIAVALAGPLASLLLSAALALTVSLLVPAGQDSVNWAISALAFLSLINLTSTLLNLLPIPGLDGYHVLAAFRGPKWTTFAMANGLFGSIAVFALLWMPMVRDLFEDLMYALFEVLLPNPTIPGMMFHGKLLLQFWN